MKRLTHKVNIDGIADVGLNKGVTVAQAMCRLADYEDTGLEPEEIDSFYIHEVLSENKALRVQREREKNGPKTNADRIRAMRDEELADLLMYNTVCDILQEDLLCNGKKTCKDCIADWLQQPAEGGENENPRSL